MQIKVYATLRPIVGGPSVQLNGASEMTVGQMLDALYEMYPDLHPELHKGRDDLHPGIHVLINGRDMRYLEGMKTKILASDEVRIFPPVGGGR